MQTKTNTTDEANENSPETVDVEIYYTRGGHQIGADEIEPGDEAFEITRDIRCFADPDDVTAETFDIAYAQIHEGELSLEEISPDSRDNLNTILGHIFSRMQDGRVDDELGYDGSETRSMMTGDVIVIDGRASLVGTLSKFADLGDIEYLRGDDVQEDDGDDDPEIMTDGGVDVEPVREGDVYEVVREKFGGDETYTKRAKVTEVTGDGLEGDVVALSTGGDNLYTIDGDAGLCNRFDRGTGWERVKSHRIEERSCETCGGDLGERVGDYCSTSCALEGRDDRGLLTVDDFDTAEALAWIVSRHAKKVRDAMDMDEHADALFAISGRLHEELPGDRDDVSVTFSGDELGLLYEATEYTVEEGPDGEIDPSDVAIAARVYEDLGGEVDGPDGEAFGEDVARALEEAK